MKRDESDGSRAPRPGRRRLLKKMLAAILVPVALLGALEGICRLCLPDASDAPLWIRDAAQGSGLTRSWIHEADPYLFWRNRKNINGIYRDVRVKTNAFGMRGDPITLEKPPGVVRILCLGESSTFGEGVPQDAIYPALLERSLNEIPGAPRVQVLNFGTCGYSTVQSAELLRREGLAFQPDVVLLYHGFNDYLYRDYVGRRVADAAAAKTPPSDLELLARRSRFMHRLSATLAAHSRAYRFLLQLLAPSTPEPAAPEEAGQGSEADSKDRLLRVTDGERRTVLEGMADLAEAHSFELVILIPAYRYLERHREPLIRFAEERGLLAVDLEEAVLETGKPREELFLDYVHPTAKLHAKIAEVIRRALRREWAARSAK